MDLRALFEEALQNLPVRLIVLKEKSLNDPESFLDGYLLDKLLYVVFNEIDKRISDKQTKLEILDILNNLISFNKKLKSLIRIILINTSHWFDEDQNFDPRYILPKDMELLFSVYNMFTNCWRIPKHYIEFLIKENYSVEKSKIEILAVYGAIQFQSLIRGFLDRRRLKAYLREQAEAQLNELKNWSVIVIQKVARGYIARKTILRSKKIKRNLRHEVLHIAEKYLKGGDIWGFLKEINDELERSYLEKEEIESREENWAEEFVNKVIKQREKEFESSWETFPKALEELNVKKLKKSGDIGSLLGHETDFLSEKTHSGTSNEFLGFKNKEDFMTQSQSKSLSTQINKSPNKQKKNSQEISEQEVAMAMGIVGKLNSSNPQHRQLSGPFIRQVVKKTVVSEVKKELNSLVNGHFRPRKLAQDIRSVYEPESKFSPSISGSLKKPKKIKGPNSDNNNNNKLDPIKLNAGKKKAKTSLDGKKIEYKGKIEAFQQDWFSQAISTKPATHHFVGSSKDSLLLASYHTAGNHLLIDVPNGIEDSIERLLHAAALRCYVPPFFRGSTSNSSKTKDRFNKSEVDEDPHSLLDEQSSTTSIKKKKDKNSDPNYAYQMYLKMPDGLPKLRYELECKKWSQKYINQLRVKGMNYLPDVAPASKFRMCLKGVETPAILTNKTLELYAELKRISSIATGFPNHDKFSVYKEPLQNDDVGFEDNEDDDQNPRNEGGMPHDDENKNDQKILSQNVKKESSRPSLSQLSTSDKKEEINVDIYAQQRKVIFKDNSFTDHGHTLSATDSPLSNNKSIRLDHLNKEPILPSEKIGEKRAKETNDIILSFLEDKKSSWGDFESSIEETFLMAAFLIVPHYENHFFDYLFEKHDEDLSFLFEEFYNQPRLLFGNNEFRKHIDYLHSMDSSSDQRKAVQWRYKESHYYIEPHLEYLLKNGVKTNFDLIRIQLTDLKLPTSFETQLEVLISIIHSNHVDAKRLPLSNGSSYNKNNYVIPMTFDPRYQKSPFDPYGRAPLSTNFSFKVDPNKAKGKRTNIKIKEEESKRIQKWKDVNDLDRINSKKSIEIDLEGSISLWENSVDDFSLLDQTILQSKDWTSYQRSLTSKKGKKSKKNIKAKGKSNIENNYQEFGEFLSDHSLKLSGAEPFEFSDYQHSNNDVQLSTNLNQISSEQIDIDPTKNVTIKEEEKVENSSNQNKSNPSSPSFMKEDSNFISREQSPKFFNRGSSQKQIDTNKHELEKKIFIKTKESKPKVVGKLDSKRGSAGPYSLTDSINASVYSNTFTCDHPHCNQVFSRYYTYQVHLKTHKFFPNYHDFKRKPQLYYDVDIDKANEDSEALFESSVTLPPIVHKELGDVALASNSVI